MAGRAHHPVIQTSLEPVTDVASLRRDWLDLESSGTPSFFQSWGWIGCWLAHLPDAVQPWRLCVRQEDQLIGLGIVIERCATRRAVVRSRALHLTESGDAGLDSVAVIHNGLLTVREKEADVVTSAMAWFVDGLRSGRWDEVYLPGVGGSYLAKAQEAGLDPLVLTKQANHYVDLSMIRAQGTDYLSTLGKRTRRNIRQSLRLYGARGPIALTLASSREEAHCFLEGLMHLHQKSWQARKLPGAFANPAYCQFHRRLIDERFSAGEIQLARVTAGSDVIGFQYNFVYGGQVSSYQSGLRYEADGNLRPGVVSDCLAIEHNLACGVASYDFLQGDTLYKRTMSTDRREHVWLILQRDRLLFHVENFARHLKRRCFGERTANRGKSVSRGS